MEVTHPDSTVDTYPLERLTKLYDGIEQIEDDLWEGDPLDLHSTYFEDGDEVLLDNTGEWQPEVNGGEWEEFDDDITMEADMDIDTVGWADEIIHDSPPSPTLSVPYQSVPLDTTHAVGPLEGVAMHELAWKRFDILPCTPHDHAYFSSTPSQPSKSFLGRLTKEYRVLSSSLPGLCEV